MSRPNVTDSVVGGLSIAQTCVLDQRRASHDRGDHSWNSRYAEALAALDLLIGGHTQAVSRPNVTEAVISGLSFARSCVLDQWDAVGRDHSGDTRPRMALTALDSLIGAHERSIKKRARGARGRLRVPA